MLRFGSFFRSNKSDAAVLAPTEPGLKNGVDEQLGRDLNLVFQLGLFINILLDLPKPANQNHAHD